MQVRANSNIPKKINRIQRKKMLKKTLKIVKTSLHNKPKLKNLLKRILNKFPNIEKKLKSKLQEHQEHQESTQQPIATTTSLDTQIDSLSPRAQEIFHQLQTNTTK